MVLRLDGGKAYADLCVITMRGVAPATENILRGQTSEEESASAGATTGRAMTG